MSVCVLSKRSFRYSTLFSASGYNVRPETPAPDFLSSPLNVTFRRGELAVLRCSVYKLGTKTV
ncbi:hypothetical protein DPMN_173559 [Dreissena polymorpha]|uniref:Uncharacterized protein n=1 Tax=Dreissena polymorpha TaxID=45954 RepID=A0A9D4IEB2_DREPO|nr:hypothetical protein DPMN_173559 [Dreissena polymorpha]